MPHKILLFGAGKSSSSLIRYFINNSQKENWTLTIADASVIQAKKITAHSPNVNVVEWNLDLEEFSLELIREHDIVISLLPAFMHYRITQWCIVEKRNMATASYVDEKMASLNKEAVEAGILLMNEAGLDPGIDHMSAVEMIGKIREKGGEIHSFKSYTGGLIADESDNNPWHYKFTWNPRNVVLAGQGSMAQYLEEGEFKYIPESRLFTTLEHFNLENEGSYEGYPNRHSLHYQDIYKLENVKTMIRGTLRKKGYCEAWNTIVQMGLTDDKLILKKRPQSKREFVNSFLPYSDQYHLEEKILKLPALLANEEILDKIKWLGLLTNEPLEFEKEEETPAMLLQRILEEKWKLEEGDKDLVVMIHRIGYVLNGQKKELQSSLVLEGENSIYTAMANTVGLPVAIITKLILKGEYADKGVQIPVKETLYKKVLQELKEYGVSFKEMELVG